jgi:hypothetical protein
LTKNTEKEIIIKINRREKHDTKKNIRHGCPSYGSHEGQRETNGLFQV